MGDVMLGSLGKPIGSGMGVLMGDPEAAQEALQREIENIINPIVKGEDPIGFGQTIVDGLDKGLTQVPKLLTHGGSWSQKLNAAGSLIGSDIGKSLVGDNLSGPLGSVLADTLPATLASTLGDAIPVVGGLVGPLLGKLFGAFGPSQQELQGRQVEGQFEQSFGGFQQMMLAVGKAYEATGRSAQQAQADVKALMDAEKQGGDAAKAAISKINDAFTDQKQDAVDLQTAVRRYGFTLDELGPILQKQNLDGQAQQLINDWRLLVQNGVDVVTVDEHMAKSINAYLAEARKTGTEVPQAMEPILQKMIDQGDLTDENGNKITDMKDIGVKFSETMTEGFQKVVDKLEQLLQKIGMVPAAIAAIPKTVDVTADVHYNTDTEATRAASGGFVTRRGVVEYFGAGGGPRGTDIIPAWLSPGEFVLNRTAVSRLGVDVLRGLNSGTAPGGVTVHVNVAGSVIREDDLMETIEERMAELFSLRGGRIPLATG
jgi:hypothetical protein